jgi:hypothetical protein
METLEQTIIRTKADRKRLIETQYSTVLSGYRLFPVGDPTMVTPELTEVPLECDILATLKMQIYLDYLNDEGITEAVIGNKDGGVNSISIPGYEALIMCIKRYGSQNYIAKTAAQMTVEAATTVEEIYAVEYVIVEPTA